MALPHGNYYGEDEWIQLEPLIDPQIENSSLNWRQPPGEGTSPEDFHVHETSVLVAEASRLQESLLDRQIATNELSILCEENHVPGSSCVQEIMAPNVVSTSAVHIQGQTILDSGGVNRAERVRNGPKTRRATTDGNPARKRPRKERDKNWSHEENLAFLSLRIEAWKTKDLRFKPWDYISEGFRSKGLENRIPKSCEDHWGTLQKNFKAIRNHESMIKSGNSSFVSFWKMAKQEKTKHELPPVFKLDLYNLMEEWLNIEAGIQSGRASQENPVREEIMVSDQVDADHPSSSALPSEALNYSGPYSSSLSPILSNPPNTLINSMTSAQGCHHTEMSQRPGTLEDSLTARIEPIVKKLLEDAICLQVPPLIDSFVALLAAKAKNQEQWLALEGERVEEQSAIQKVKIKMHSAKKRAMQNRRHKEVIKEGLRGQCTRNHSVAEAHTTLDGCNEYAPQPDDDLCMCCGCHKNFHVAREDSLSLKVSKKRLLLGKKD